MLVLDRSVQLIKSLKAGINFLNKMEEDKKIQVGWGVSEGVKFGFGFGMGIFLWVIFSLIVSVFIISLFLGGSTSIINKLLGF